MGVPGQYVELGELEVGQRFRFLAFPEQRAVLVHKGIRAMIRYETARAAPTRTFVAHDKSGQPIERTITVKAGATEPCALGAQVVPLTADGHDDWPATRYGAHGPLAF